MQKKQYALHQKDWVIERKGLERDSLLYSERVLSAKDYEEAVQQRLQKENSITGVEASLTSAELGIMQNQQQLIELSLQRDNEIAQYERNLSQYRQQLLTQISQWHQQ